MGRQNGDMVGEIIEIFGILHRLDVELPEIKWGAREVEVVGGQDEHNVMGPG